MARATIIIAIGAALLLSGGLVAQELHYDDGQVLGSAERKHAQRVQQVAFTPDGRYLLSAGKEGLVKIWRPSTGQHVRTLTAEHRQVWALAVSPDSTRVAVASSWRQGRITVWEIGTGQLAHRFDLASEPRFTPLSLAWSADGTRLAAGDISNGTVQVLKAATGELERQLSFGEQAGVKRVAFLRDDRWLLAGSFSQGILIWDSEQGGEVTRLPVNSFSDAVPAATGGRIFAASGSRGLKLLELPAGKQVARFTLPAPGISATVGGEEFEGVVPPRLSTLALSPDGRRLASGDEGSPLVRIWDVGRRQQVMQLWGHAAVAYSPAITSVAFSPDGELCASGSTDGTVRLWRVATGLPVAPLEGQQGHLGAVACSPDGTMFATACDDGTVWLWNSASGQPRRALKRHARPVQALAFASDGQTLVSVDWETTIKVWSTETGLLKSTFRPRTNDTFVGEVAFIPGSSRFVVTTAPQLGVWDVDTGFVRHLDPPASGPHAELESRRAGIAKLAITPDGKRLVTTGSDATLRGWDLDSGKLRYAVKLTEEAHAYPDNVAISSDGTRVIAAVHGVHIHDVETGEALAHFTGKNHRYVDTAAFLPDGAHFAGSSTAGSGRWIAIYRLDTGKLVTRLDNPTELNDFAISPDGGAIFTADRDSTVTVFRRR